MSDIKRISINGEEYGFIPAPSIEPNSRVILASLGKTAKISVSDSIATGSEFTYQWQYSITGKSWANTTLSGYNTDTLSITASSTRNGYLYRCKISNGDNSVTSEAAKLIII